MKIQKRKIINHLTKGGSLVDMKNFRKDVNQLGGNYKTFYMVEGGILKEKSSYKFDSWKESDTSIDMLASYVVSTINDVCEHVDWPRWVLV